MTFFNSPGNINVENIFYPSVNIYRGKSKTDNTIRCMLTSNVCQAFKFNTENVVRKISIGRQRSFMVTD